jgi:type IV secretion system protein VirD4
MLPQEVQSLGTDHAIIFYESTRPIRCRKIRYFRDRHFQARLYPPPGRPLQQVTGSVTQVQSLAPAPSTQTSSRDVVPPQEGEPVNHETAQPQTKPLGREATLEDIQQWDQLKLHDFAGDFSRVELPVDRPATGSEMSLAVDQFLDGLKH